MITPSHKQTARWCGSKPASTNPPGEPVLGLEVCGHERDAGRVDPRLVQQLTFAGLRLRHIHLEAADLSGSGQPECARVEACAKDDELAAGGEVALDGGIDERHARRSFELRRHVAFKRVAEALGT